MHDLDGLFRAHDEPFGSAGNYAHYHVFRTAAEKGLKVMLGGQAGDGLFAGDMSLWAYRWAGYIRAGNFFRAAQLLQRFAPSGGMLTLKLVLLALAAMAPNWLLPVLRRVAGRRAVPPWMDGSWFRHRNVDMRFYPVRICRGRDFRHVHRIGLLNLTTPRLLRYNDRNAMAHSVEHRVPFLTPRLVEFAAQLPESFLIDDDGLTKNVFRRAMRGIVPDAVLDRRDKIGFAPPQGKWLTALDPWVRETLSPRSASRLPCLRSDEMIRHCEKAGSQAHHIDRILWRWLNAIHWTKVYNVEWD